MTDNLANQSRREVARARTKQVYFDIKTLLPAASWLWPGSAITSAAVARTVGLRPNTILDMDSNRVLHVTFLHFGLVAWYFGVGADLLLRYRPAEDDVAFPELERDLALIDQGLPPADPPSELPHLRRQQAPAAPPGSGAIVVINRVPLLISSMNQSELAELTGRARTNISRYMRAPVSRIARSTIAELMEAFRLDRVSAILDVQLKLDCYSDTGESAPDAVRIETLMPIWNSIDWFQLVQRWRVLADGEQKPEPLADVDVAAIRYIYAVITANQGGRAPRLGGQLSAALGVSRETISNVVSGDFWQQITALDLPVSVQQLIHQTLQLPPLEPEQDTSATDAEGVDSR
jgi:transcriptional regulator with XRE-family HTH domain